MRRLLALLAVAAVATAADKPVPTKDAAGKMKLPDGFKVQLFAGEPDIVQPIAFTFDDRGRMWVVECLMYPKWSQDGKGGKDRVVILEDTDGDGKADKNRGWRIHWGGLDHHQTSAAGEVDADTREAVDG